MASQTSPFDSTRWYRFFNTDTGSNLTISSGQDQDTNGAINMTTAETFSSSENWQLFFQSGIFFIRNYDYNTEQLGISSSSSSNPALTNPSGDLSQQWNLTQWSDGTWKVQNLMLGNAQILGLSPDNTVPSMEPSDVGGHWNISENPSAGQITLSALLNPLANIANVTSTTTSSSTSLTSSTATSLSSNSTTSASPSNSSSVSGGAIAGAVVGGVAGLILIVLALIFFTRRRRPRPAKQPSRQPLMVEADAVDSEMGREKSAAGGLEEVATPPVELPTKTDR